MAHELEEQFGDQGLRQRLLKSQVFEIENEQTPELNN